MEKIKDVHLKFCALGIKAKEDTSWSVIYAISMQATHLVGSAIRKCVQTDGESLCHRE